MNYTTSSTQFKSNKKTTTVTVETYEHDGEEWYPVSKTVSVTEEDVVPQQVVAPHIDFPKYPGINPSEWWRVTSVTSNTHQDLT